MISLGTGEEAIASFTNPFKKEAVSRINFQLYNYSSSMREGKRMEASVSFTKGKTSGIQSFYGDDFNQLVAEVKTFIDSLK